MQCKHRAALSAYIHYIHVLQIANVVCALYVRAGVQPTTLILQHYILWSTPHTIHSKVSTRWELRRAVSAG